MEVATTNLVIGWFGVLHHIHAMSCTVQPDKDISLQFACSVPHWYSKEYAKISFQTIHIVIIIECAQPCILQIIVTLVINIYFSNCHSVWLHYCIEYTKNMAEWLRRWNPVNLRLATSRTRDQINLWPVDQGYPHTKSGKVALACEPATGWLGMVDCPIRHSVLLSVSMLWHGINIYRDTRTVQWRIQGETPSWLAILTN